MKPLQMLVASWLLSISLYSNASSSLPTLTFLDELIIDKEFTFKNTSVGGLSSVDFHHDMLYMISDHGNNDAPSVLGKPRVYSAKLSINNDRFEALEFDQVINLLPESMSALGIDPESLRVVPTQKKVIWTSEGDIKKGISPAIYETELYKGSEGSTLKSLLELPDMFDVKAKSGPYHNAAFEGLSLSHDNKGIWVAMEGPLKQDGHEPTTEHGALVRLSYFDLTSGKLKKQFAFEVDAITAEPLAANNAFRTTGIVEVMQYDQNRFIVIERAYTSGLKDGGNRVKLFMLDISEASNVASLASLKNQPVKLAKKHLLLDMENIRAQLPSQHIDNIEGVTFGPVLSSGKRSLILVSDNNFNAYGNQLTQLLLFEISE